MTAERRKRRDEIKVTVGPFRNLGDYSVCMDLQREVWRCSDAEIVPLALLRLQTNTAASAWGRTTALGNGRVRGQPSRDGGGELIQHSHLLGVRSAYRNFEVGFKLKLAQRKETLRGGSVRSRDV